MEKSYLIKRKSLLLAGIKDADDTSSIIGFDNMSLRTDPLDTDPTNFVLVTEGKVNQMVLDAERNSHKQIKGDIETFSLSGINSLLTTFNNGGDLTFIDGEKFNNKPYDVNTNPEGATPGDVVFFVQSGDVSRSEEALVTDSLKMVLMTHNNIDEQSIASNGRDIDTLKLRAQALEDEDVNLLKIDNTKDVSTTGAITQTGTETAVIANREDVRQVVVAAKGELAGNAQTLTMTQLEAADVLLRARLDAIEQISAQGKKVFDTGATLANGNYAPKKNMVVFDDLLVDGSQVILTDIPTTSMDGGVAFVAADFAMDTATPPQGPEVQLVVYGDESDPTTTEDSLDAAWKGTQTFGTMRAGKLHGIDMATGHWSANFAVNNDGVVVMTGFTAAINPSTNAPYPVKRVILVQATLNTLLYQTELSYSKTESDTKYADKSVETSKQDRIDNALSTTSKIIVPAINEVKALLDTTRTTQAQIGDKRVSDGEHLLDTGEVIATEAFVTKAVAAGGGGSGGGGTIRDMTTVDTWDVLLDPATAFNSGDWGSFIIGGRHVLGQLSVNGGEGIHIMNMIGTSSVGGSFIIGQDYHWHESTPTGPIVFTPLDPENDEDLTNRKYVNDAIAAAIAKLKADNSLT